MANKVYEFWQENKIDKRFEMDIEDIKTEFLNWLKTKEKSWLEYYVFTLVRVFVTEEEGLNSVMDNDEKYNELKVDLNDTKWEHLNSININ